MSPSWHVLVIDGDDEIHDMLEETFGKVDILGRKLVFVHGRSVEEALAILRVRRDFAVILLDTLVGDEDEGLRLVVRIREEFEMHECRVILRTNQQEYVPRLAIFNEYDINDYRSKAELTPVRLITLMIAAIRSYMQIDRVSENRRGLELIVHAASDLMERRAISAFAEGVLTQVASLLKLPLDGIVCAQRGAPFGENDNDRLYVVGAAGRLANHISQPIEEIQSEEIINAIRHTIESKNHFFNSEYMTFYLKSGNQEGAVFVYTGEKLPITDRQLLEVFASNLSACFGNVKLVEQLNFTAYHDPLTSLPNRTAFIRALDRIANARTWPDRNAIALIDMEHFADLNDGMGHDFGDSFLIAVGDRLQEEVGDRCYVSRIGGDVFGVVGPESIINPGRILAAMQPLISVNGYQLPIGATLGFCLIDPATSLSGVKWLTRASIALNLAKKNRYARYIYFSPELEESTRRRLEIISWLRSDFAAKKLSVWFQPQISLQSGTIVGIEALVRWPDTNGGFVQPPHVFIPLAEYSGLIIEIGEWVLGKACDFLRAMQDIPRAPGLVAVNVSMPQFRAPGFAEHIKSIVLRHGMQPSAIELEITESLAMEEPKLVIGNLQALKNAGFRVAIDDFGTGYSSLGHLRTLPIDCLKIDRAFVMEINAGKGGVFAETIIELGKKLGFSTTAEGVETAEQAEFLCNSGCDSAQGYLFGKPMPAEEMLQWIENYQG